MRGALSRYDDRDIEPHTASVARDRIAELEARGFDDEEAMLTLLMRGARIEVLAQGVNARTADIRVTLRYRLKQGVNLAPLIVESQRGLDLWRRV